MDDVVWRAPDDLGITIPVLGSLFDGYAERRRRELYEDAVAHAASRDKDGLESLRGSGAEDTDTADDEFVAPGTNA